MRRDAGDASIGRILLEHLPDDLFGHSIALYLVASVYRPEHWAVDNPGGGRPSIDGNFDPGWHRYGADAAVLANKVHNAPATIALLDVRERERRHLGTPESAAEEDG